MYKEEDLLLISGIQHYSFCKRQWALIHIEQQWDENVRTIEGMIVHENAHDGLRAEKRQGHLITRGMRVYSHLLGFAGNCDVVEFDADEQGSVLAGRAGLWKVTPIEYKRGKSKSINADRLQLCLQALCLEEMLSCQIERGFLYYAETHRREEIVLGEELREEVKELGREMHLLFEKRQTPKARLTKSCNACSLKDVCLPKISKKQSAENYITETLFEE